MVIELSLKELRATIRESGWERTLRSLRKHTIASKVLRELVETEPTRDELAFLAGYPLVPGQLLEKIASGCQDAVLCRLLAENPRSPQSSLAILAASAVPEVRAAIASCKTLPPRTLAALAMDSDVRVRRAVATNPSCKGPTQAVLVQDQDPSVRAELAAHPALEPEMAAVLASDPSPVVRASLWLAKWPGDGLARFATAAEYSAQRILLDRNDLTTDIQFILLHSPYPKIRQLAWQKFPPDLQQDPALLLWLCESDAVEDRLMAAHAPILPKALQRMLACDADERVREALAGRKDLAEDIALHLAVVHDLAACLRLAENPAIPASVLDELCHIEREEILVRLAYRDDLRENQLHHLVNVLFALPFIEHYAWREKLYENLRADLVDELIDDERPAVRAFAAGSRHLQPRQADLLARDAAIKVRQVLLKNPAITRSALSRLGIDEVPQIAEMARARLRPMNVHQRELFHE